MRITCSGTIEVHGVMAFLGREVEWEAECDVTHRPGRFSGPPEQCYEDESECNIVALVTRPEGLERFIPDDVVEEAAWAAFEAASEAAYESEMESRAASRREE